MSTYETAALWSATQLATDQTRIGAAGLSVRQRKLLTLLSQPMSVAQIASSIALPIEEVHAALDRFARLGLAQTDDAAPAPFDPMQLRATTTMSPAANAATSRMPMMIGVVIAALALVAAAAWLLRGNSSSTNAAPSVSETQSSARAAPAPTATGSADSADTVLPKAAGSAAAAAPSAAMPSVAPATPTAPPAATKALADAATKAAAPATKTGAQTAAPATATPLAVAPSTTAASGALAATAAPTAAPTATSPPVSAPAAVAAAPVLQPVAAPVTPPVATVTAPATVAAAPAPARAAPAAASREIKLVTRVEPQFPRGFDNNSGTVRARLQVDARGAVTGVDIVEANPPRVFDRNVRSALQQWRYEPTGEAFSTMAEISFSR